jgi:hypothetical protein
MIKLILAAGSVVVLMASCSLREDIHVNANNSVDRDMLVHLDTAAAEKLVAMAAMAGQQPEQMKLDSIGIVWDSATSAFTQLVKKDVPEATVSRTTWNRSTASGALHFGLPDIAAYNKFANSTLTMPGAVSEQMPIGGLKKQQLEWRGKDTLVISLDNSKPANAVPVANEAEMKQAVGMIKMMLGVPALVQYKASFYLPRTAKSVTGADAILSPDKKMVTIEKSLDESNTTGQPDEIKVIF